MKIQFLLVLFVLAVTGCGQSEPVADRISEMENPNTHAQPTHQAVSQQAKKFAADLKKLTYQARQQEAAFHFSAAAKAWGQVQQLVTNQFGPDAWQTKNAMVAFESADAKSQVAEPQLPVLRQIVQLTNQVKQNLEIKKIEEALSASNKIKNLQSQLFGSDTIDVAQTTLQIAVMEARLNRIDSAIENFHAGIRLLQSHGYTDHPELELAHAGLASMYVLKSKLAPAAANQKEATRIAGLLWGQNSLNFATQANQLGAIFHQAGNLEVALEILGRSKLIRQKELGSEHPAFAHSCLNLGVVMVDLKRFDEAEEYLSIANSIFQRAQGTDSALINRCQSQLATLYMLRQQPELAEPLLQRIVSEMQNKNSVSADELLTYQYRLSVAMARQGKYEQAGPILQYVMQQQQQVLGSADKRTVATMRAYAMLLERTSKPESAASVRQQISRVAHLIDDNDFQRKY